jgi:hypothetical protein
MISELLSKRNLPELLVASDGGAIKNTDEWEKHREYLKDLLCREEYGYMPPSPLSLTFETIEENKRYCASKAIYKKINATVTLPAGSFTFPFYYVYPAGEGKYRTVIHINFRDCVPDMYMPTEEIIDNGLAIASFCYTDVTSDDGDFTNGLAAIVYDGSERTDNSCGKIMLWAYAAMRVADYVLAQPQTDAAHLCVAGHSRLGKTALVAGAFDERFTAAYSNDSGCSGAAISRGKVGESIEVISRVFPFWFCKGYRKYAENEYNAPFDQHTLLSLIAPRRIYVASAQLDEWADPESEFLACAAVNEVYELYGLKGLVHANRLPEAGDALHEGNVAYHMRSGTHYFSRTDWLYFMEYFKGIE